MATKNMKHISTKWLEKTLSTDSDCNELWVSLILPNCGYMYKRIGASSRCPSDEYKSLRDISYRERCMFEMVQVQEGGDCASGHMVTTEAVGNYSYYTPFSQSFFFLYTLEILTLINLE
jgi:hypothetical protein